MITGVQLVEKLYSQGYYIEEQREFGIISARKGIKKLIKGSDELIDKLVDPIRKTKKVRKLAEKIQNDINKAKKDIGDSNKARVRLERLSSVNNKITAKELKDIAKDKNTYLIYDELGEAPIHNSPIKTRKQKDRIKERFTDFSEDDIKGINENDDIIVYPRGRRSETPSIAHELGHIESRRSGNPMEKIISRVSGKITPELNKVVDGNGVVKENDSPGLIKSLVRKLKTKAVIEDESNATKRGLKMIENLRGKESREYIDSKNLLENDLKHHKSRRRLYYKTPLLKGLKPRKER